MVTPAIEQSGNAFQTELSRRFRGPLTKYFYTRTRDRSETEDLVQQVFLRLLASGDGSELQNVEGFVFTIAANLLRDRARASSRAVRHGMVPSGTLITELVSEAVEDISPERVLLGREALADVMRALDQLGEKTRDIYILFRLENMKQREIAELLGIGHSTVEKHVMRATLFLARKYGED